MPIVNRLDLPLHYLSWLGGKYLNGVPVLVMCPLQPMRSDMQNGTDLLRQKGDKANVKLCSPELGLRLGMQGWGHVVVVVRLCKISVCLWAGKGLSVEADVQKHTLFTYAWGCVGLYMQLSASLDITFKQLSPPVTQPSPQTHAHICLKRLDTLCMREGGCLVLLWGPKPVNDGGHQKPHRWLI